MKSQSIHGSPAEVRDRIEALGATYGGDDFIVVTVTHVYAARLRSYELLAEAFGLPAPS